MKSSGRELAACGDLCLFPKKERKRKLLGRGFKKKKASSSRPLPRREAPQKGGKGTRGGFRWLRRCPPSVPAPPSWKLAPRSLERQQRGLVKKKRDLKKRKNALLMPKNDRKREGVRCASCRYSQSMAPIVTEAWKQKVSSLFDGGDGRLRSDGEKERKKKTRNSPLFEALLPTRTRHSDPLTLSPSLSLSPALVFFVFLAKSQSE